MPFFIFWLLVFNLGAPRANQKPGIKVVMRHASNDHTSEFTTYTMPDRRRSESRNSINFRNSNGTIQVGDPAPDVTIVRCDLVQYFELNTKKQEYAVTGYPPVPTSTIPVEPVVDDAKLPTIRAELTTVDTGERKQMFGHTARHVISTMKQSYPDAPNTEPEEYVTDGWYIDLDQGISCAPKRPEKIQSHGYGYMGAGGRWVPVHKTEYVEIGPREKGFALKEVQNRKVYTHVRLSGSAYELEVTELFEGPLDPALFEVPADFKRVEHVH
jgi:hypothetical protein